jgi:serine/threonine protein kinase
MAENGEEGAKKLEEGAAVVVGPAEEPLASATADNVLEVPSGADTSANEEKNENVDKQGLAEVDPKDVAPSLANPKTPKVGEPNRKRPASIITNPAELKGMTPSLVPRPRDFVKLQMLGKGDVGKVFLVTPRKAVWHASPRAKQEMKNGGEGKLLMTPEVLRQMSAISRAAVSESRGSKSRSDAGNTGGSRSTDAAKEMPLPTELFAMKVVNKKDVIKRGKAKRVMLERDILASTNHPFIVTMYRAMQTKDRLYFFLQYCPGGEFFRMLRRQPKKRIPESYAKFYASEILLAIEYLHLLGFIYRDLKPENILVHMSGHLMLADFDLARCQTSSGKDGKPLQGVSPGIQRRKNRSKKSGFEVPRLSNGRASNIISGGGRNRTNRSGNCFSRLCGGGSHVLGEDSPVVDTESQLDSQNGANRAMSFVGTVEYIAPEVIENKGYAGSVDWWTFGILLFEMLHGTTPFKGKDTDDTFANIYLGDFEFPRSIQTSEECKDLLRLLLAKEMKDRLTSPHIIRDHPFFHGVNWALLRNQKPPIIPEVRHPLDTRNFRSFKDIVESDDEFLKRGNGDVALSIPSDEAEQAKPTAAAEGGDDDVIEILTPGKNANAADKDVFEGFDWVSPRQEDPHWDDLKRCARTPKKLSIQESVLKMRIKESATNTPLHGDAKPSKK